MSRFIVIKRKDIILYSLLILLILFVWVVLITTLRSNSTFHEIKEAIKPSEKYDLNGDGLTENVIEIINNNYYSYVIKTTSANYKLKDSNGSDITLDINEKFKPKINYLDLDRNNIPEIIINGLKNNKPVTYIYSWQLDKFENILYTDKNIVGILNSNNSKSPQVLYTLSNKGDESTEGILLCNNSIKNITPYKNKIPSLSIVQKFIDLIQLPYELDDAPGIFTPTIPSDELSLLWNLDKETTKYSFINGYFYDTHWNDKGSPTSIIWVLSFEKNKNNSNNSSELTLNIKIELDSFGEYKISNIQK